MTYLVTYWAAGRWHAIKETTDADEADECADALLEEGLLVRVRIPAGGCLEEIVT